MRTASELLRFVKLWRTCELPVRGVSGCLVLCLFIWSYSESGWAQFFCYLPVFVLLSGGVRSDPPTDEFFLFFGLWCLGLLSQVGRSRDD